MSDQWLSSRTGNTNVDGEPTIKDGAGTVFAPVCGATASTSLETQSIVPFHAETQDDIVGDGEVPHAVYGRSI
jgi:hypothetical protein